MHAFKFHFSVLQEHRPQRNCSTGSGHDSDGEATFHSTFYLTVHMLTQLLLGANVLTVFCVRFALILAKHPLNVSFGQIIGYGISGLRSVKVCFDCAEVIT
jgi:hypothetical protein